MKKYQCPCCGYFTYNVPANEDCGYICPVCFWENDPFIASDNEPSDSNHGIIKTDEAGTLDFSGVPAFLVTNAFIVQRSAAKMFNIVSGPQLLSIHQGFCDYRPGFQCPWTHDP